MIELPADRKLLATLNRKHWGGRLPRYRVVRVEPVLRERDGVLGQYLGYIAPASRSIYLSPDLAGDALVETLLHELCHVAVEHCLDDHGHAPGWAPLDGNHGPRFQAELARVSGNSARA
jgi:SprT-like family protein